MEQRRHPRLPLQLEAFLHYPPLGLIRGRTRDLSLEGMFVDVGGLRIPRGVEVTVSLPLAPGIAGTHRYQARVVHARPEGVGLVVVSAAVGAMQALDRWLRSAA